LPALSRFLFERRADRLLLAATSGRDVPVPAIQSIHIHV